MMAAAVGVVRSLRWATLASGALDLAVASLGAVVAALALRGCGWREKAPATAAAAMAAAKIASMAGAGIAQGAVAAVVAGRSIAYPLLVEDEEFRLLRKMRYKKWLWWTRFGMVITALQFVVALYLICVFAKDFSSTAHDNNHCLNGLHDGGWKKILTLSFLILVWLVVIIQCSTGSDVLRWRSFYATHDTAWKAHYREVFDHGIREVLCCLGRVKYLSVLEEDEVYSVARLLGDLVAYRASGTRHLELLAGLALLQKHKQSSLVQTDFVEAPDAHLQEAAHLHQFAEAAYTGPLLDFGRNPIFFPCAWLHRQGVLSPWSRNRRPKLEGDNWWRGHAAAFLKYVGLPPEALRRGRVSQTKREAAHFIVVLHDLKMVVIAVRGTETPEDLITDGLCGDCVLSMDDLDGIINSDQLPQNVKESVLSSFPHYGHSGIIEYARELFMQIDGKPADTDETQSNKSGFLSSLMGIGCECYGYKIHIVGHSLGGAVAALLGVRLYARYPNLHVYTYGSLPCVDSIVAEACSEFITCIIYNDEFSARLSVNSVLRLRAAAIGAVSNNSSTNSALVTKIVRRIIHTKKCNESDCNVSATSLEHGTEKIKDNNHATKRSHLKYTIKGGAFLCGQAVSCMVNMPDHNHNSIMIGGKASTGTTSYINGASIEGPHAFAVSRQPDRQLYQDETYLFDRSSYETPQEDYNSLNQSHQSGAIPSESSNNFHVSEQASAIADDALANIKHLEGKCTEVYIPGLIIHIIRVPKSISPNWKSWILNESENDYRAFVANRENFRDIVVSPYMFLDHLPWRCHYAIKKVIEARKCKRGQIADDLFKEEIVV